MKIKTVLNDVCENTTGYPDNTWNITDKRRQVNIKMSGKYNTHKKKEVGKEYASQNKEVKKLIWRDHRRYMDSNASKAQSAADLGNIKGIFDSIKRLINASKVSTVPVTTKDGKCITTSKGQLQKRREFLKEILNSDCLPYEEVTHSVLRLQVSVRGKLFTQ
jgi:hypothetical protein